MKNFDPWAEIMVGSINSSPKTTQIMKWLIDDWMERLLFCIPTEQIMEIT